MDELEWTEITLRLSIAAGLGGLIGLERERKNWSAGLRTHIMVCVGSCLIMLVSMFGFGDVLSKDFVELDPSRVAAQVVSGIGFIGAGTILFQKRGTVRGLTTAAGMWTVAAIGLAIGGGMYLAGGLTTALALIILWAIQPLEKKYARRFIRQVLRIKTLPVHSQNVIENIIEEDKFSVKSFQMEKQDDFYIYNITFDSADANQMKKLISDLEKLELVKEVSWAM